MQVGTMRTGMAALIVMLCDVEVISLPALLLMLMYIHNASSDELQHPSKRGSKTLFAIRWFHACGGKSARSGNTEGGGGGEEIRLSCKYRRVR